MEYAIDISLPNFAKLNNDEYSQLAKGIIKLVEASTIEKLAVKELDFKGLKACVDKLTEASRQTRLSHETEQILALDKQRTELLSYLLSTFRLERKNSLKANKDAATALYKTFKNYTGTQTLPSRQKSQAIDALLKDCTNVSVSQHLEVLRVMHAVNSLKELNKNYQDLVGVRAENQLNAVSINVKEVRKEAVVSMRAILRCALGESVINQSQEANNFLSLSRKLIEDAMIANKQRLAQSAASRSDKSTEKKEPVTMV